VEIVVDKHRKKLADISEGQRELKVVNINTSACEAPAGGTDKMSESITADEDMHVVAIEHFIGVSGRGWYSDNGHILSKSPDNPWVKWAEPRPSGIEPTGTKGYFGYCGRDYYTEVSSIKDVTAYESLPAGCHFLVKKEERLYMLCYADNFTDKRLGFHHAVHLIYW